MTISEILTRAANRKLRASFIGQLAMLAPITVGAQVQDTARDVILQEIIVTAQKRAENVMEVPISITALSGQDLADSGARTLNEFNGVVPGITFTGNATHGISHISIRGVSGSAINLMEDPIAIYIDGAYQFNQTFGVNTLFDIESFEVVRGPQGTLQGRNATAGALLITTSDPEPELGGYVRASMASEEEYRVQGVLTGPLSDTLSGRLAVDYIDERGWAKNTFDGSYLGGTEAISARGILLWTPNDELRARLSVNYQTAKNTGALARWSVITVNPDPNARLVVLPASPPTLIIPKEEQDGFTDGHFTANRSNTAQFDMLNNTLELSYDFGGATLVSLTSFNNYTIDGRADADMLAVSPREAYSIQQSESSLVSEELRLQSNGDRRLSWILGGYASTIEQDTFWDTHNHLYTEPTIGSRMTDAEQTYVSFAGFGDVTYRATQRLSLTGGLRYTYETKDFSTIRTIPAFPSGVPLAPGFDYFPPQESWDDVSFRTLASFQASDDFLVYASYSKGFKSGGFNAFANTQPFGPEELYSLEIGTKAELFNDRARITLSVYDSDYENLQVTSAGLDAGGLIVRNAAEASIRGFELEFDTAITDSLRFSGNLAHIDAEYELFPNTPNAFGTLVDASGNRLMRAPEWQYFARLIHQADLSSAWSIESQAAWRWRDTLYFSATNQDPSEAALRSEPGGELGARISLHNRDSQLTVALFGNNLTNERLVTNLGFTYARPLANFNKPRIYGLELTKRF